MGYTLACKDFGLNCPYVAKAESEEQVMKDAGAHAKSVHSYTDAQLNDPAFMEKAKRLTKKD
jgi:predicted small metal-binding protein